MKIAIADITLVSATVLGEFDREIPLGLLYLAAALEKSGVKVEFRDFQLQPGASPHNVTSLAHLLMDNSAPVIGISCLADTLPLVVLATAEVKKQKPEKTIVLGGPGPSGVSKKLLQHFPWIDIVVRGEGEETLVELLGALKADALRKVKGISYRSNDGVISNPPRPRITNLDGLPYPSYHLVDWNQYRGGSIATARGCPYRCAFCDVAPFWKHQTVFHGIDRTLNECSLLRNTYGVQGISVVNDSFTLRRQWTKEFCQKLYKARLDVHWTCLTRVDLIDEELMEKMAEAGCTEVFYGLESGSDSVLEQITKGLRTEQAWQTISRSINYFNITGSFVVGFPFESMEDFYSTINFAAQLSRSKNTKAQLTLLMALPLSPLYSKYGSQLTRIPDSLSPLGANLYRGFGEDEVTSISHLVSKYPHIFTGYFTYESPSVQSKIKVLQEGETVFHGLLGHTLMDDTFGQLVLKVSSAGQEELWQGTTAAEKIGLIHLFNLVRSCCNMRVVHHLISVAKAWQNCLKSKASRKAMDEVVGRAAVDQDFLLRLVNGAEEAVSGYDLTGEEKAILHGVSSVRVEQLSLDQSLVARI